MFIHKSQMKTILTIQTFLLNIFVIPPFILSFTPMLILRITFIFYLLIQNLINCDFHIVGRPHSDSPSSLIYTYNDDKISF